MIPNRHWCALLAIGSLSVRVLLAEDVGESSASSSSGSGGTGGFGESAAPSSSAFDFDTYTPPTVSSFGQNVFSSGTAGYGGTGSAPGTGTGSSYYGLSGATAGTEPAGGTSGGVGRFGSTGESAPSYTLPGFFGQGGQTFVGGEGRLARPDFETSFSLSMGYDDNIFQTPSDGKALRVLNAVVLVDPGSAGGDPIVREGDVFVGGGGVAPGRVVVGYTKRREPIYENRFTDIPAPEREGSVLTRANFGFQTQFASRRYLFTLDLGAGTTYYWNKDEDPYNHHGSLGVNYLYRLTPRLQLTASVNSALISQPDYSRANTPDELTRGEYLNTLSRTTLAYRVTPRFSLSVSGSYNSNYFFEKEEQFGNYGEWVFGTEARYLWSPRYTFLVEFRHSLIGYPNRPTLDSTTSYLLLGTEFILNRRLSGSLRLGESIRQFEAGGDAAMTPYVEAALSYRTSKRSTLQWTNRFGFEEPGFAGQERLVLRTGLTYAYAFTPRLRGSASAYFVRETVSDDVTPEDFQQLVFDSNLGLSYTVTEHFGLSLSYNFTNVTSNRENVGFYKNRIFLGAEYRF